MDTPNKLRRINYKHSEHEIMKEIIEYIDNTYSQNKFKAMEFIIESGHGEGFCIGNILKYAQRYGEKDEKNRNDLLKVIYYTIIALHNDSEKKKEKE